MATFEPDNFVVLLPGVYSKNEKALVEKYLADIRALEKRGNIDVRALIRGTLPKDTPGLWACFAVSQAMVRYNNKKYDPRTPSSTIGTMPGRLATGTSLPCPVLVPMTTFSGTVSA